MRASLFTLAGLLVCGALLTAAQPPAPQAPDPAKVAAGQKIYAAQKCDTCHAIAGKGGKSSVALDGVASKLSEADIRKWLTHPADMEKTLKTKPKAPMSTFMKSRKLTDADIDNLTAYMMSLK